MKRRSALLAGAALLASTLSRAGETIRPVTLLILPFENATGRRSLDPLQAGIPDLLTAFLAPGSDRLEIVERSKLDVLLAEQSLRWENVMEKKSYGELGRLAQARYLVRGSFISQGRTLRIQALLYETETMRLVKSFEAQGEPASLNAMLDKIASELASSLSGGVQASPAVRRAELPSDPDPQVNLHLIYGLGYYYGGQYTQAIPEFMKILALEPRHADAEYWLIQSYVGAHLKSHAALEAKEFLKLFPQDRRGDEVRKMKF